MKLKLFILTVLLLLLFLGEPCAWEQDLQLVANELKVLSIFQPNRIAIGDPEIVDITVLNNRELMLMAKSAGTTTLIIWDELGQRSFNITVIGGDFEKVAQRIERLLASADISGVSLKVEEDNIYVVGDVLNERELNQVQDILTPFAHVVNLVKIKERQPLVEIDVHVLEIAIDDLKTLGLDWSTSLPIQYSESGSGVDGDLPKVWKVFRWSRSAAIGKLNFLIEEDKARTLANPKLVTISGKEASFLVGGEVPYLIVETDDRTSTQWKNYGVNLIIKPMVNSKHEINTKIKAEVSDLDWTNAVTHQGYNIPALNKREAETELFLNDGDTIFLAGLIKNEDSRDVERLPWLSKVPILGELFKSRQFRDKRTELVISLTPKVIAEKERPEDIEEELLDEEVTLEDQDLPVFSAEPSPLIYYSHMIEDIITRNAVYPLQAQEANQQGTVRINLQLLSNGQVKEVKIKESSGFSALDEAAIAAVQKQAPYPAFPPQIAQSEIRLTVPVVFEKL